MSATSAPVLHTERLILRGPEPQDLPGFLAYFASPRSRYTGGPLDPGPAWRLFACEIGHWHICGFGMWSVTLRGHPDRCIGMVGCWHPADFPENELGWILWPEAEGRGIAAEAAQAARAHAYGPLGWTTAVSYIDPENARSIGLAERLGARRDDAAPRRDPTDLVYRHPAPEALQ